MGVEHHSYFNATYDIDKKQTQNAGINRKQIEFEMTTNTLTHTHTTKANARHNIHNENHTANSMKSYRNCTHRQIYNEPYTIEEEDQ